MNHQPEEVYFPRAIPFHPTADFRPVGRLLGLPKIPKAHGGIRMDYVKIALLSINSLFVALAIVICKTNVINLWKYNTIRRKKGPPRPPAAFHPSTPKSTARIKQKVDKETFTRCCLASKVGKLFFAGH